MFKRDKDIIYQALNMWANYIETGDVALSATDAHRVYESELATYKKSNSFSPPKSRVRPLTHEQMSLIVRIRDLATDVLNGPNEPINKHVY